MLCYIVVDDMITWVPTPRFDFLDTDGEWHTMMSQVDSQRCVCCVALPLRIDWAVFVSCCIMLLHIGSPGSI